MIVNSYLNLVISVVVQVEDSVQFAFSCDVNVCFGLDTFSYGLTSILFHLDIVEFSTKKKVYELFYISSRCGSLPANWKVNNEVVSF